MSVFNPKILDASIRDVTSNFNEEAKVDVLIYAMQYLKLERSVPAYILSDRKPPDVWRSSRSLIENAVESCLRLPKLSPEVANKARLLRAKARLAASLHAGANQGRDPSRLRPRSILG